MNALTRRLIAKDLYLLRWLIAVSIGAGLLSLLIAAEGAMRFNIGCLGWITTLIAAGIMVSMFGIANERKERSQLFVLSLPLSHRDYVRIKLLASLACYLPVWLVLSAGAVLLVLVMPNLADGLIPYTILLSAYMLTANFAVVLCAALHFRSEGAMTAVIVAANMGISVFIFVVGALPAIHQHLDAPAPVWNTTFWTVLLIEILFLLVALALPLVFAARRRDYR
jgi:hypothetical protein